MLFLLTTEQMCLYNSFGVVDRLKSYAFMDYTKLNKVEPNT